MSRFKTKYALRYTHYFFKMELSKRFDFKAVDAKWAKYWEEKNCFHAEVSPKKKPYSIVIPPPNVTGILHMGHALNNTLQDIMIRYKRMQGFETMWMAGTDHAGIATQNVVEKDLAKIGKTRQDLGREEFLKRLWEWKNQYGDTILRQLKSLGASCDWERTRFTMDEPYSEAVKKAFVELYKKGLIYRGEYIINWCPRCQTALSDEEAEHKEVQGNLYHIRYPFKGHPQESVIVATTRPETMLGDTAVAVNPKDKRYKKFVGKTLILPLIHREVPIIADDFVDPKFGTGAVKVTPAHDPNDFQMGKRHKLEFINILHPDGRINEKGGNFSGQDRFKARAKIIESLKELNLLVKVEQNTHQVGHCYRCNTIVEPYISKQWFVKMKPLAKPAIEVVKKGKIKFYPERWTKVYLNWMEEIRDWCISRQIWWGHRIPVWYCVGDEKCLLKCKEPIVSETPVTKCPHCGSTNLRQDEDVLDTWFSSWLWPFATLNWPEENKDLKYFYPTNSLFTASEIIFFWVARMIMAGIEFRGEIPFSDVYIHGTVRDAKGRKMSKSFGNAIDPLEIINEYGADALRFSLIINSGQDLFISKEKFEIGRNFANKIWNATRLILMNAHDIDPAFNFKNVSADDLSSRWIVSRFYSSLKKISEAIEGYRFSEAENLLYEFFWGNFCDWYLEMIKDRWNDPTVQNVSFKLLEVSLKMLHPFMPFVTEEIWSQIHPNKPPLCLESWPQAEPKFVYEHTEQQMQTLIEVITSIRNLRAQWNIKPSDLVRCYFVTPSKEETALINDNTAIVMKLAQLSEISINQKQKTMKNVATAVVGPIKCYLPLGDYIDVQEEKQRILNQMNEQERFVKGLSERLTNEGFLQKAPPDVVEKEKERLTSLQNKVQELKKVIESLE